MSENDIYQQFEQAKSWEERYRLLIQFSRKLPKLTEEELAFIPEIEGCESRLWFSFQLEPRQVEAYSDARLMQGILAIVKIILSEKSQAELANFSLMSLFEELKISQHLTSTRLNGLGQIQKIVHSALAQ